MTRQARGDELHLVQLDVVFVHQTPAAVLIKRDEDSEAIWIPKSVGVVLEPPFPRRNSIANITLPEWKAIKEGLC